ncbi:hypothetical protein [Shewanella colwelliana]|uniref:hypothetical protein n=1 Tax=Shewanella colwelliana TaxID=23 RepID=UPI00299D5DDA|nr:hypothetical protein [Shewanella colwelliana]MDX1283214.1 hypothetical protein [Shewanella colwelliana]
MKTLFKIVVFGSLSLVAFFIGMIAIAALTSVDKAEVFEPHLTETAPKLVKWEHQTFKDLMIQDAYNTAKPEQWDLYIKKLSTLGALKSFEQAELQNWQRFSNLCHLYCSHGLRYRARSSDSNLSIIKRQDADPLD